MKNRTAKTLTLSILLFIPFVAYSSINIL